MTKTPARLRRARSLFYLIAVCCLGLGLLGCGDQPAPTASPVAANPPPAAVASPQTVTVDAVNFKFAPGDITIPAGSTVVWTNKDAAKHTVTANDGSFDSGVLEQGATYSRKFDTPGTVGYFCKFHGSAGQGMAGTIHVVAVAAAAGAPAANTPPPVQVDAAGFKFAPLDLTVPAGTTVTWTNKDAAKHTVTANDGSFDSGVLEQGATYSRKFDTPGTIGYFCKFHGSAGQGMAGTIHVVAVAAAGNTPAPVAAAPSPAATVAPPPPSPAPPTATAPAPTAAPSPTPAPAPPTPGPAAVAHFRDDQLLTDGLVLTADTLPAPPAGKGFFAWLTTDTGTPYLSVGRVQPDAAGHLNLTFSTPEHGNLLATYNRVIITAEPLTVELGAPSLAALVADGRLPAQALVHIRHLLVSFPATPKRIGLVVGLRGQVNELRRHAEFLRDAQAAGDLAGVRLHAEHLVNLIEGAKGPDYGDLNHDGQITNPGDGYGLLPNGDQLGYLQGTKDHAALAAEAPDATADIKLHAGHVGITVDNIRGWVTPIRDRALILARATDLKASEPLVREILALAGQALNGVDLRGDGQILPIPGSGGALTGYQHAQLMAAIPLAPGPAAGAGATPLPVATPVPPPSPAASPTPATGAAVQIDIRQFKFGEAPLTVKAGTTVTWTNRDDTAHTTTADDKTWDSGELQPGQSFSFTFSKAGSFPYYCALHGGPGGQGMASTITVTP